MKAGALIKQLEIAIQTVGDVEVEVTVVEIVSKAQVKVHKKRVESVEAWLSKGTGGNSISIPVAHAD